MKMVRLFLILTVFLSASLVYAEDIDNILFEQIPNVGIYGKSNRAIKNIKKLLRNEANPNAQKDGKTVVMHLIENYRDRDTIRALQKLLRKDFNKDIDFIADNGMTALTFAASFGNQDIIGMLLKAGADSLKKDAYGMDYQDYLNENKQIHFRELKKIRDERTKAYAEKKEEEELKKELEEWKIIEKD